MRKRQNTSCGIGGQAVIEGLMVKGAGQTAVAVRKPDRSIQVSVFEQRGGRLLKAASLIPLIRGIVYFLEVLLAGVWTLIYTAEGMPEKKGGLPLLSCAALLGSLAGAFLLFFLLPRGFLLLLQSFILSEGLLLMIEGAVRVAVLLAYLILISGMKDVRRLYQYHGAGHQCINCIEKGYLLTVENVKKSKRRRRFCETSFVLFVIIVTVILSLFIHSDQIIVRILLRLCAGLLSAAVSYEVIRGALRSNNLIARILAAPEIWLQQLTTAEPDEEMLEVAIAAVDAAFDWRKYYQERYGYRTR